MLFPSLANNPNKDPNLKFSEKFSYGLGDLASQILYTPTGTLLIYYYTEFVGVNIATVATIMLVSRFFDGFSDLFVGWLVEKTNTPYGKSRVWILRMIVPFFIAMVMLFSVPSGMSDLFKYIYIFVSYNFAITLVYTAANLPYGTLGAMMTKDQYARSIIVVYRMLCATAGNTIIMTVTLPMVEFFGNDQAAWTWTFAILGVIACACFFCTFYFCHERVPSTPPEEIKQSTFTTILRLFKNKYWVMLTLALVIIAIADIVFFAANTYFCRYFLNNAQYVGTYAVVMNIVKVSSMIIILPILLKKIGKRNALLIASCIILVTMLARLIDPNSVILTFVCAGFFGLGQGATYACMFAMIPDTIEYGEYLDHERHEGLVYSGVSFGTKVAAGLGTVIPSFIMDWGGYVNNAESQSESAMNAILMATTFVPAGLYVIGIICALGYKLDKMYPDIIRELQDRHTKKEQEKAKAQQQANSTAQDGEATAKDVGESDSAVNLSK